METPTGSIPWLGKPSLAGTRPKTYDFGLRSGIDLGPFLNAAVAPKRPFGGARGTSADPFDNFAVVIATNPGAKQIPLKLFAMEKSLRKPFVGDLPMAKGPRTSMFNFGSEGYGPFFVLPRVERLECHTRPRLIKHPARMPRCLQAALLHFEHNAEAFAMLEAAMYP